MAQVLPPPSHCDFEVDTIIIGAGACGLIAALAAKEQGQSVVVLEQDIVPAGSTALSAGLIPAAGTQVQVAAGITDTHEAHAEDIIKKASGEPDEDMVRTITQTAPEIIDWLINRYDMPFLPVTNFDYPGHSCRRMHGLPKRSGQELIDRLRTACEANGIDIVCQRYVEALLGAADGPIYGVRTNVPDGSHEIIGCRKLIIASNGFGGNKQKLATHIPKVKDALYFGHEGNRGDALEWAEALSLKTADLGAYQGHGNVAHPHGILISWAVITEGGFQVNTMGHRFWNETLGYSEAAQAILKQPQGQAFTIFDSRIADIARQFADFQLAEQAGAIKTAATVLELADLLDVPVEALQEEFEVVSSQIPDQFLRTFDPNKILKPPYHFVKVTGALFHTQGGIVVDSTARAMRADGTPHPNIFVGGGAARGISGSGDSGYLSGNGLLTAVTLGYLAGKAELSPKANTRTKAENFTPLPLNNSSN